MNQQLSTIWKGVDPYTKRPVLVFFAPDGTGRAAVYADDRREVPHAKDIWTEHNDPWGLHDGRAVPHDMHTDWLSRPW